MRRRTPHQSGPSTNDVAKAESKTIKIISRRNACPRVGERKCGRVTETRRFESSRCSRQHTAASWRTEISYARYMMKRVSTAPPRSAETTPKFERRATTTTFTALLPRKPAKWASRFVARLKTARHPCVVHVVPTCGWLCGDVPAVCRKETDRFVKITPTWGREALLFNPF